MLTSWYPRVTKPLCVSQPIVSLLLGNTDDKMQLKKALVKCLAFMMVMITMAIKNN